MQKTKTLFAILMVFAMTLSLTACGSSASNETSGMQAAEADLKSWIDGMN